MRSPSLPRWSASASDRKNWLRKGVSSKRCFSDALNWLEALVSSVSLVCAIEESITRISDLVMAVKKFAYDERSPDKELDVHDSLQSTLTILGHKLRIKQFRWRSISRQRHPSSTRAARR